MFNILVCMLFAFPKDHATLFLLELAIKDVGQALLEGQATLDYKAIMYANATKWQHLGIFNTWGRQTLYSLQRCVH